MKTSYTFPFGQPVKTLKEHDIEQPKSHFVLGVYASAVHARWVDSKGKQKVAALAVASEPYIFWQGEQAEDAKNRPEAIIKRIKLPDGIGKLEPAHEKMNGPSGISLDECFLKPLGITRKSAWLCDIVPHSCLNPMQAEAIKREYDPLRKKFNLPEVTLPPVPKPLCDEKRQKEITAELLQSGAKTLVLLGDDPVRWLHAVSNCNEKRLGDFGRDATKYGKRHKISIGGKDFEVIPLVHPRQASSLGTYSSDWHDLHQEWMKDGK